MGFNEAEPIDPDEMLVQECDLLAPCALERAITPDHARNLRCKVLAEGANGPTTPDADAVLNERGDVLVIPDILCNAGGVTVSYFEWVQNLQRFQWTEREILTKLETNLQQAFAEVATFAKRNRIPMRTAAQAIAIRNVADTKAMRGLFP